MGLNWLDVSCSGDLRIKSYIDNVATDPRAKVKAIVHLDSSQDTVVYSAGCNWLDICKHDRDFQFGTYATGDKSENPGKPSAQVTFDRPFCSKPDMIVWIQDLDVSNSADCRIRTYASDITATGFTINVETWDDTKLNNARVTWIAHPTSRSNIRSGRFHNGEVPIIAMKYLVTFDKKFEGTPDVYVGFSQIDIGNKKNLRLKTFAEEVRADGMTLNLNSWNDTVVNKCEASWLAIQSC